MRGAKTLVPVLILLSLIGLELSLARPAVAFPGDRRDEDCAERIAAAEASTPDGETPVVPADCLPDTGMTALELRAAEAEMAAEPVPDVIQVPYNEEVVWTRAYRRMIGDITMYDAPNGNPIGHMGAGYNFVTIINEEAGFTQINWGCGYPASRSPTPTCRISPASSCNHTPSARSPGCSPKPIPAATPAARKTKSSRKSSVTP